MFSPAQTEERTVNWPKAYDAPRTALYYYYHFSPSKPARESASNLPRLRHQPNPIPSPLFSSPLSHTHTPSRAPALTQWIITANTSPTCRPPPPIIHLSTSTSAPPNDVAVTTAAVVANPRKATLATLAPPPLLLLLLLLQRLPILPLLSPLPRLSPPAAPHVTSITPASAEPCLLTTSISLASLPNRISPSRSFWIRILSCLAACRRQLCGRCWGGCLHRGCWRRRRCVKGGGRRLGGCGGPRKSSDFGFRRGLRSGLLDPCCRSVPPLLGSLLRWKG